ncbi:uncharacterized protein LY89DRAFT_764099 [Mollisia scopiformis]|uniref:Uncharacterized protein n=1 Tax=Mollisia scopiformis TaxID=149040 RepID=A0A132BAS6_MOLSC|nr:uncharacterized protein LY89DRAFT_764099 [Mollisia scopiformis]KUJ08767.1 hypothetical protein LY89DRAFT_764099 [Mollisia scopiformis]
MASSSDIPTQVNKDKSEVSTDQDILWPYLQKALISRNLTGTPVSLFNDNLERGIQNSSPDLPAAWPTLKRDATNQILLFPGSFNPPHQGDLATIRYFSDHCDQLGIVAMFIFADPDEIIGTKEKKWGKIILPQKLHNRMFAQVPELSPLIEDGWLHLLVGDMEGHIQVLRTMTGLISEAGFDVKLVGFFGGDKLSVESPPHLPPGDLTAWGPIDDFLITNARRPVVFYDPGQLALHNLPGCTEWERAASTNEVAVAEEQRLGELWFCKALTVPGEPYIQFRASHSSASNGISSTRIRKIMVHASVEEIYELLKDEVLSIEVMIEWLQTNMS